MDRKLADAHDHTSTCTTHDPARAHAESGSGHAHSHPQFLAREQAYQQQIAELWGRLRNQTHRLEDTEARLLSANRTAAQRYQCLESRLDMVQRENQELQRVLEDTVGQLNTATEQARSCEHERQAQSDARERADAEVALLRTLVERATESADCAREEASAWRRLVLQERQKDSPAEHPETVAGATSKEHARDTGQFGDETKQQEHHLTGDDTFRTQSSPVSPTMEAPFHAPHPAHMHTQLGGEEELDASTAKSQTLESTSPPSPSRAASPSRQTAESSSHMQSNLADLATGFVGALTQAIQASSQAVRPQQDSELRKLTARQASVNVTLPEFSGKAEEWPSFIRIFRSSTQQCGFSNAENVQRLQQCLKGPAKSAVRLQLAVPDNIEEAIKTLGRRFGRPELVVSELIEKAKSFKPVRAEDTEGLLAYTTAVSNVVMTMNLLNSPGHMMNPALRQELVDKLPTTLRLQWGEHLQTAGLQHTPESGTVCRMALREG